MGDCWSQLLWSTATWTEFFLSDGLTTIRADGHTFTPFHFLFTAQINKYAYNPIYQKRKTWAVAGPVEYKRDMKLDADHRYSNQLAVL
jgi:hypothetical protein